MTHQSRSMMRVERKVHKNFFKRVLRHSADYIRIILSINHIWNINSIHFSITSQQEREKRAASANKWLIKGERKCARAFTIKKSHKMMCFYKYHHRCRTTSHKKSTTFVYLFQKDDSSFLHHLIIDTSNKTTVNKAKEAPWARKTIFVIKSFSHFIKKISTVKRGFDGHKKIVHLI